METKNINLCGGNIKPHPPRGGWGGGGLMSAEERSKLMAKHEAWLVEARKLPNDSGD